MSTPITAGTSLEVISPYLAHDLELADVKYPELRYSIEGVVIDPNIQCLDVYPTWQLASGDFEDDGPEARRMNYTEVMPVLRPFRHITKRLSDGTIPLVEVARLALNSNYAPTRRMYQLFDFKHSRIPLPYPDAAYVHLTTAS